MFEGCFDIFDTSSELYLEKISGPKLSIERNNANGGNTPGTIPTRANINSLPEEILAKIFTQIIPPERNYLRQVSKSWKNILDTLVGTTLRIGTVSEYDPEFEFESYLIPKYHSPSTLSKIGIDHLLVGDLSENWEINDSWGEWLSHLWKQLKPLQKTPPTPIPPLKSPGLVSLFSVFGQLSSTHFSQFLDQLPGIRIFSVSFYTLQYLHSSQLENLSMALPLLEILVIRAGLNTKQKRGRGGIVELLHQLTEGWDLGKILTNTLAICGNYFPKLEYASLQFVYEIEQGLALTKAQLQFLSNHSATLKSVTMSYILLIDDEFRSAIHAPESHPELVSLMERIKGQSGGGLPQLKGLRIVPMILPELPFSSAWDDVTKEQKCLTEFSIMGVYYEPEVLKTLVDTNYKSLKSIFIWEVKLFDDHPRLVKQLDFGLFNKCENLKKLSLRGWTLSLNVKNVINVDQLPKSLTHIDLRDMAIPSQDVKHLALELPVLKSLDLHFIGDKREMGMDLLTLREIIRLRSINQVKIFRSLNGKLYTDGIFNGNIEKPDTIIEMPGGMIAFQMGSSGYYRNSSLSGYEEEMSEG